MKQFVIIGALAIIMAGFFVWYSRVDTLSTAPASTLASPSPSSLPTIVSEGGPDVAAGAGELSLPTFAQRQFNGHDFTVGRVLADNEAYTQHYITYESGELTISGIMNVPKDPGPHPVLILAHGYIDPAVYTNGRGLRREQDYLARRGYVIIHPDYRNHAQSDKDPNTERNFRLGYAEDVINLVHAVRAANLPYVAGERIGMLGHSMGGGVAWVIAVTQPELIDAFVLFAPVSADVRDNFEKWTRSRREVAEQIIADHGSPADSPEFWDSISPLTFFADITSPILIHHGTADESVPLEWSERAARELAAKDKDASLEIYPGEPHEFAAAWTTVMGRTAEFFNGHLKP